MTALECQVCGARIASGSLCVDCLRVVVAELGDLAGPPCPGSGPHGASLDLLAEVEVTIARQTRGSDRVGGQSRERPLPVHFGAVEERDRATNVVLTWWRDAGMLLPGARRGPGDTEPPNLGASVTPTRSEAQRAAQALAQRPVWIAAHPAAVELCADIAEAVERLARITDRPPERHYLGPCLSIDLDGQECPGDVHQTGARPPECDQCGATHSADDRQAWIADMVQDQLVTAAEAAGALSAWGETITSGLVRKWAERGRIVAHGRNRDGRPVYRFGDCRALAVQTVSRRG